MIKRALLLLLALVLAWLFGPALTELLSFLPLTDLVEFLTPDTITPREFSFYLLVLLWTVIFWLLLRHFGIPFSFLWPSFTRYSTTKPIRRIQGIMSEFTILIILFVVILAGLYAATARLAERDRIMVQVGQIKKMEQGPKIDLLLQEQEELRKRKDYIKEYFKDFFLTKGGQTYLSKYPDLLKAKRYRLTSLESLWDNDRISSKWNISKREFTELRSRMQEDLNYILSHEPEVVRVIDHPHVLSYSGKSGLDRRNEMFASIDPYIIELTEKKLIWVLNSAARLSWAKQNGVDSYLRLNFPKDRSYVSLSVKNYYQIAGLIEDRKIFEREVIEKLVPGSPEIGPS